MGRRTYPHVEIHDDFVLKRFTRKKAVIELEYAKANAFFDACTLSGIEAAQVLDVDFKQKTITYKRIKNYQTIEQNYIDSLLGKVDLETARQLQNLAGKGLAAIHRNMNLDVQGDWLASSLVEREIFKITGASTQEFLAGTPQAIQHGDYGFANLGYRFEGETKKPRLIIFDPSPNNYITQMPNEFCSIYVDMGLYFSDINGRVPVKFYPRMQWSQVPLFKTSFIEGYQQESGLQLDPYKAEVMGYCSAAACYEKFYGDGVGKKIRLNFLYNKLKKNVFWK